MTILGIETSCDECAASVVRGGRHVLSNVIASQIADHEQFSGVVPELASRLHTQLITGVTKEALSDAGLTADSLDGIAVTNRPGLSGSLLVGLSFAKGFAAGLDLPYIGIDHIQAHLYAPHLEADLDYPYLGVLVSGGHTVISVVHDFDCIEVLGTTIDDAIGEAFDKVAKHCGFGYPGGAAVDRLAAGGDRKAFNFPVPKLKTCFRPYDLSYSGLKTAVVNQLDLFHNPAFEKSAANIAAAFQYRAVSILFSAVRRALDETGLQRAAFGGGVAANSLLRSEAEELARSRGIEVYLPSLAFCTDNAAMIAGLGYQYLRRGDRCDYSLNVSARVDAFKSPSWKKGWIEGSPSIDKKVGF
jgi:N6-L-threonylcarbamoyladenine synthase